MESEIEKVEPFGNFPSIGKKMRNPSFLLWIFWSFGSKGKASVPVQCPKKEDNLLPDKTFTNSMKVSQLLFSLLVFFNANFYSVLFD